MNWIAAVAIGFGTGLAFFGGLWLTIRGSLRAPGRPVVLAASTILRLALVGLVFAALALEGAGYALAGLGGLLLARRVLIGRVGGPAHGG